MNGPLPKRGSMWWHEMTVITGAARAIVIDASQIMNHYAQQTAANGNEATHGVYLDAGTYSISMIGETTTSFGIVDWWLDDTTRHQIVTGVSGGVGDWYSAALTRNVLQTTTGIVVSSSGWHRIAAVTNGKNAASSSFGFRLTRAWFFPASD